MANPLKHFGINSEFIRGDTSSYNCKRDKLFDEFGISSDKSSHNASLGLMIKPAISNVTATLIRPVPISQPVPVNPNIPRAPDIIGNQPKPTPTLPTRPQFSFSPNLTPPPTPIRILPIDPISQARSDLSKYIISPPLWKR